MLPRAYRIVRSGDFRRARSRGRAYPGPLLVLHVYRRPGESLRAGFTASKKVGKATVRNRVKRLMRESLRARLGQVKPGYDLILTARPAAAEATFGDIRHAMEELLVRSRLVQTEFHA